MKYLSEKVNKCGYDINKKILMPYIRLAVSCGGLAETDDRLKQYDIIMVKSKIMECLKCYISSWRTGGMPEMVFEYILKKNGIGLTDLTIVQNIDFGNTSQAFVSGQGDYTIEFEPSATGLETENEGKVVASLGVASGKVPYTAYAAKKSYIEKHPETIQKFTNAIQKGLDYVNSHTPEEIAKVIHPQFKETDMETLTTIVTRYYEQETWKKDLIFEEESFDLLQNILEEAGELNARVPYSDLIKTEYAEKAVK